jgi:MarR family transcriptional regulator, organic hydroperoxide resistance regulator
MATRTISKAELAQEVGRLLGAILVEAKKATRPLIESEGVTMPQAMALQTLQTAGGRLSARDLGRDCHMLASTVTGVIDRLEAAGYVRRERDERDRRVVWVALSDEGNELAARLPRFTQEVGNSFAVLPARDLEQMRGWLEKVLAAAQTKDDA